MTDPIADALTRIRNAYLARKTRVVLPHSKVKEALFALLKKENYISEIKVLKKIPQAEIHLSLNYAGKLPAVSVAKRISKPGRRVYIRAGNLKPILSGEGIAIISTSKGLMTDKEARKQKLGGELICTIS